jgi:hypothetical protein
MALLGDATPGPVRDRATEGASASAGSAITTPPRSPGPGSEWSEHVTPLDDDWSEGRDESRPRAEPEPPVDPVRGRCSDCRRPITDANPGGECTFCSRVLCDTCEEKSSAAGHPGLCSVCSQLVDTQAH